MNLSDRKPLFVEKEEIDNLKFPNVEVLQSADDIKRRELEIQRALTLGNIEHNKIRIIFEDSKGLKQVETTVWGVTDNRIILKQGVVLPIYRIHELKL